MAYGIAAAAVYRAAIVRGGDTSAATFIAPDTPGTYRVRLVVTNGLVESTPATAVLGAKSALKAGEAFSKALSSKA